MLPAAPVPPGVVPFGPAPAPPGVEPLSVKFCPPLPEYVLTAPAADVTPKPVSYTHLTLPTNREV